MNALLGNYLSMGDLIVVHMCGSSRNLTLRKKQEYLGLTITDNGHGRAFIKKIRSRDWSLESVLRVGDHIAAINSRSTLGMRHFEVAKSIREIPQNTVFTLQLIEPLHDNGAKSFEDLQRYENDRIQLDAEKTILDSDCSDNSSKDLGYDDLINSSLPFGKLLSKSAQSLGSSDSSCRESDKTEFRSYRARIEKINSILESFLGINDNVLAVQIYRAAMDSEGSLERFVESIETSDLNVFGFSPEIKLYLWRGAIDPVS